MLIKDRIKELRRVKASELRPNPHNWRTHPEHQKNALRSILAEIGYAGAALARELPDKSLQLIDGHLRAETTPDTEIPVLITDLTEEEAKLLILTFDPLGTMAGADNQKLNELLEWSKNNAALAGTPNQVDFTAFQKGALGDLLAGLARQHGVPAAPLNGVPQQPPAQSLASRFLVPPFSVLDARQGYWQERKWQWLGLGIKSEVGRGVNLLRFSDTVLEPDPEKRAEKVKFGEENQMGGCPDNPEAMVPNYYGKLRMGMTKEQIVAEFQEKAKSTINRLSMGCPAYAYDEGGPGGAASQTGTSIFDPVLCELAYRWFCPLDGDVLDPFAGGSVRGIIAAKLGRRYVGIDLRQEQVAANEEQLREIMPEGPAKWVVGDAQDLAELAQGEFDFLFTCPPYHDLEQYSDDKRDLSNMKWADFLKAYRKIIKAACGKLKENRFACFVVGDIRDDEGIYRNFPAETIRAFQDAGLKLYNEAILVTQIGSLPIRVGKQFMGGRKLGKTHQNVLVFVKGDGKLATEAVGPVEIGEPGMQAEQTPFGEKLSLAGQVE